MSAPRNPADRPLVAPAAKRRRRTVVPAPAKKKRGKAATPKKLSRQERQDLVERTLRRDGWSYEILLELVQETGWSRPTIYRDRAALIERLVDEDQESLPRRRAAFLLDLRRVTDLAVDNLQLSPAARLLAMQAQVQGLDRPPPPELPEDPGEAPGLEGMLQATRRMRRQAEAAGSWTAAARLLQEERALVEAIDVEERRKKAEELANRPDAAVLAEMVSAVEAMSPDERAALRAALERT